MNRSILIRAAELVGRHAPIRFLIAGGTNTLLTLGIYWLMLTWMRYSLAYTISFIAGIFTSYAFNTFFVFRERWSWSKLAAFPLVQGTNYLLGLGVLWTLVSVIGVNQKIAPVIVVVLLLPVNYLLSKLLITRK